MRCPDGIYIIAFHYTNVFQHHLFAYHMTVYLVMFMHISAFYPYSYPIDQQLRIINFYLPEPDLWAHALKNLAICILHGDYQRV